MKLALKALPPCPTRVMVTRGLAAKADKEPKHKPASRSRVLQNLWPIKNHFSNEMMNSRYRQAHTPGYQPGNRIRATSRTGQAGASDW